MNTHKGYKPFQCAECGKGFAAKKQLASHEIVHKNLEIRCEFCPCVYKNINYLRRHQVKNHAELVKGKRDPEHVLRGKTSRLQYSVIGPKLVFPCEPCGIQFQYKSRLVKHLKGRHGLELGSSDEYPTMWTVEDNESGAGERGN